MAAVALLSTVPVALGLFLLAFGVPGRPFLSPAPRNLVLVGVAAVALGPVAQLALGFGGWLSLIGALVAGTVVGAAIGAAVRPPRGGALQE